MWQIVTQKPPLNLKDFSSTQLYILYILPEAKRMSTELMTAASQCLLLGVTWYRKGVCMDIHET